MHESTRPPTSFESCSFGGNYPPLTDDALSPKPGLLALDPAVSKHASGSGLGILLSALVIGAASDLLLLPGLPGLGFGLLAGLVAGLACLLARRLDIRLKGEGRWVLLPAVLSAFGAAWRDSGLLFGLNVCLSLLCLGLAAACSRTGRLWGASLGDYMMRLVQSAANATAGCLVLVFREIGWRDLRGVVGSEKARAVIRGILLAMPLLVVFGLLFIMADATFERMVSSVFSWIPDISPGRLFWLGFISWLTAGFLRQFLFGRPVEEIRSETPAAFFALGSTEANVALLCLNLLFVGFVATQVPYLFGGIDHVAETTGLTLSAYVRRGFFELVTVAALVLPMLLAADWMVKRDSAGGLRLFRILSGTLIALLFVIMASALQRMLVYVGSYGMTELRLYVTAFMFFLAVLFIWFGTTVLRGRRDLYAGGALVIGLVAAIAVQAGNPDAMIAKTNLERKGHGESADLVYLASLGGESVAQVLKAWPTLSEEEKQRTAAPLLARWVELSTGDWRSWNAGRRNAQELMRPRLEELKALAEQ